MTMRVNSAFLLGAISWLALRAATGVRLDEAERGLDERDQIDMTPTAGARTVILFTDPGPDPDDVKTIILGVRHDLLAGVVVSGGSVDKTTGLPVPGHGVSERGALAKAVLDGFGEKGQNVPVVLGTAYPHTNVPNDAMYHIRGKDVRQDVAEDPKKFQKRFTSLRLMWLTALADAAGPLVLQVNAGFTDVAKLIKMVGPEIIRQKVQVVSVQGAIDIDGKTCIHTNCEFDKDATQYVIKTCADLGISMNFMSRDAVPPMRVDYHTESGSALMAYLSTAQVVGLQGLWKNICGGWTRANTPDTRQWFLQTFTKNDDAARAYLTSDEACRRPLEDSARVGIQVKPYDVFALMTVYSPEVQNAAHRSGTLGEAPFNQWDQPLSAVKESVVSALEHDFSEAAGLWE